MQVIIDLLGLTIKNGGIKVYDGNNSLVLYVDQNTKKLNFSGTISGTTITGTLFDGGTIRTSDGDIGGWLSLIHICNQCSGCIYARKHMRKGNGCRQQEIKVCILIYV